MDVNFIKSKINSEENFTLIEKALNFSESKLNGFYSVNGESLFKHILQVTNILIQFNADSTTLISCILYETMKSGIDKKTLEIEFNHPISNVSSTAFILNNQNEIIDLEFKKNSDETSRAIFIKLANIFYTLSSTEGEYQKTLAKETLDIWIPIARKFNLNPIKSKLEDLCFFCTNPEDYNNILKMLDDTPSNLEQYLNNFKNNILTLLINNGINCTIKCRVKNVYSIYNKLMSGKKWEEIFDILALRVIVENEEDCNKIIKLIHSRYSFLPNRFKDYINNPKENMYQSLHTTIIGDDNRFYEIQIRTNEMNKTAEIGSASHQLYKEKKLKKIKNHSSND